MMGMMIETVVMAFVVGGIFGAITALQLKTDEQKVPVKILRDHHHHNRRIR